MIDDVPFTLKSMSAWPILRTFGSALVVLHLTAVFNPRLDKQTTPGHEPYTQHRLPGKQTPQRLYVTSQQNKRETVTAIPGFKLSPRNSRVSLLQIEQPLESNRIRVLRLSLARRSKIGLRPCGIRGGEPEERSLLTTAYVCTALSDGV